MPVFEFETPQGRFQVDAPDQETAIAAIGQARPAETPRPRSAVGAGAEFLQGALFNRADEITAGLMTPIEMAKRAITGEDAGKGILDRITGAYSGLQQDLDQDFADYERDNPITSLGASLAGGLLSGGAAVKSGATLIGRVPKVAANASKAARVANSALRNVAAPATEAAAYGLAYGTGASDANPTEAEYYADAGRDALIGGAMGIAAPIVVRAVQPVLDATGKAAGIAARHLPTSIRNALGVSTPADDAAALVLNRVNQSGQSVEQIAKKLERSQASGSNLSTVDVMGPSGRDLLRTTTNVPGKARDAVTTKLTLRDMAAGDRVLRSAERGLGAKPAAPMSTSRELVLYDPSIATSPAATVAKGPKAGGYQATKAAVQKARSTGSRAAYDAAYASPVPWTTELEDILATPAGRAGLAAAKRNSANRREPWKQFFASIDDDGNILDMKRVPDARALDEVKRVLDNMVEAAKRPADGSPFGKALATPESIAIQSVRDDLLNVMVKETGGETGTYAKALQSGATNIQADQALEFGRSALRGKSAAEVTATLGKMNDSEKALARQGVMEAIRGQVQGAGDTHNTVLKLLGSKERRNVLRPFFPSAKAYNDFYASMLNEARMRRTFDASRGNSTTVRQLMDMQSTASVDLPKAIAATVAGGPQSGAMSAAMDVMRGTLNRLGGMTPEVAAETANILMAREPGTVRMIVEKLRQIERAQVPNEQKRAMLATVLRTAGIVAAAD